MASLFDWISDDITFCMEPECGHTECGRHASNIRIKEMPHSFAKFKGTEYCPLEEHHEDN